MKLSKHWKLLAAVCALALSGRAQQVSNQDMSMEVSGFRVPQYDGKGVMSSQLFGDRAEMEGGGEVKITGMRIEFYKESNTVMTVTSPYCFYNQQTREAHSDAPIAADMDRMTASGRGFHLDASNSTVQVLNDSKVTIKEMMKQVSGGTAGTGSTNAPDDILKSMLGGKEPKSAGVTNAVNETVITSKELFLDYKTRTARFEHNVHVKDPRTEMFCDTLTVRFSEKNQIDWIGAETGVRILNEGREALAEKAEYDVKMDEFVLKDNPRIIDGKNMLMGDTIRFWRANRRMVCEPAARAVVYSDNKMTTNFFEK